MKEKTKQKTSPSIPSFLLQKEESAHFKDYRDLLFSSFLPYQSSGLYFFPFFSFPYYCLYTVNILSSFSLIRTLFSYALYAFICVLHCLLLSLYFRLLQAFFLLLQFVTPFPPFTPLTALSEKTTSCNFYCYYMLYSCPSFFV